MELRPPQWQKWPTCHDCHGLPSVCQSIRKHCWSQNRLHTTMAPASPSRRERPKSSQKSFCTNLDAFLTPLQAAGDELIVMGDLNEQLGDSTSGMNAVVAKFGLVDSTAYHHGIEGEIPTYSRSNSRLDYILCSHGLAPSIWRCGILPFNFVISSDHRGVFIDVNIDNFLGGDPSPLMSAALRGISSTC
jgi:hypothetical protein